MIFSDYVVTTSPFGAQSAKRADWSPLRGRDVTIWPDNDGPGVDYALDVLSIVLQAKIVPLPSGVFRDGWDLADDAGGAVLRALLEKAAATTKKKKGKAGLKESAEKAARERENLIRKILAMRAYTVEAGCTQEEADTFAAKAEALMEEHGIDEMMLEGFADTEVKNRGADLDGDAVLDSVFHFLGRFVSYPSRHAQVAHVLWICHTHLMDIWDSTTRIAFMSPERGSGKTRALEVTEFLVPRPVHSVNNSVAYIIRKWPTSRDGRQSYMTKSMRCLAASSSQIVHSCSPS
jgi:hypothetical protein